MTKPKVLINCSNLHVGGGVSVATSVIECLSGIDHDDLALSLLMSTEVESNLRNLGTSLDRFCATKTIDYHGASALFRNIDRHFNGFDLIFTVFGPVYSKANRVRHLCGFAQPNIIDRVVDGITSGGPITEAKRRIKIPIQEWFFSRVNALVVELEYVRESLQSRRLFKKIPIYVVHSAVHSIFNEPERWRPISIPGKQKALKLGVISRNYPHKNLAVLVEAKRRLVLLYNLKVDIFVTFTEEEWRQTSESFKSHIFNIGALSLDQCPAFYHAMNGVVFPSLSECFSAVPIEAMVMERPLFASNRRFIRDICEEHCIYFDPLDPSDIARVIFEHFNKPPEERHRMCVSARIHASRFSNPMNRATEYLGIIKRLVTSN